MRFCRAMSIPLLCELCAIAAAQSPQTLPRSPKRSQLDKAVNMSSAALKKLRKLDLAETGHNDIDWVLSWCS